MTRPGLRAIAAGFAGSVSLVATLATAEPTQSQIATARKLFGEAAELRQAGKWAEAADKLREAIAIKETPGLRFHLAHCEEELGNLVAAEADYDRAAELITDAAKAPDVASLLPPARSTLHERVPKVIIRPASDLTHVRLLVDGREVSTALLNAPISLDPGSHSLRLEASGHEPWTMTLSLDERESRELVAAPVAIEDRQRTASRAVSTSSAPATSDSAAHSKASFRAREIVLIAEGALTLAGAVVGTVYAVRYSESQDRIGRDLMEIDNQARLSNRNATDACHDVSTGPCADLLPAYNARVSYESLAIGGFVGAGVGVASLLTTWLFWPNTSRAAAPSARIMPTLGGVVVTGAF